MERKLSVISNAHPILLFDGECGLCQASVQWVIRHDKKRKFRFVSLQSPLAQQFLKEEKEIPENCDSLILLENGKARIYSTAALRTLRLLGFPRCVSVIAFIFPKGPRDFIYRLIARYRHRIIAPKNKCIIPEKEHKSLFIDGARVES